MTNCKKNGLFGTAISDPFDLALFSISKTEISSSNANSKFSSGISHYSFLALVELSCVGISFKQAEE